MSIRQAGHRTLPAAPVVRARRTPHAGQNVADSNIMAKQDGQLTVARVDWQYLQARSPGPTGPPQLGQ